LYRVTKESHKKCKVFANHLSDKGSCISYFYTGINKIPDKNNLRKQRFILVHSSRRVSTPQQGGHGRTQQFIA
jgi:hypothetical protein